MHNVGYIDCVKECTLFSPFRTTHLFVAAAVGQLLLLLLLLLLLGHHLVDVGYDLSELLVLPCCCCQIRGLEVGGSGSGFGITHTVLVFSVNREFVVRKDHILVRVEQTVKRSFHLLDFVLLLLLLSSGLGRLNLLEDILHGSPLQ